MIGFNRYRLLQLFILIIGILFLYIPIISLIVYSFNESQLVTVWTRFSTRWYQSLWNDQDLLNAFWLSIKIATVTATVAVFIGTWAGYVLARMGRFRGYTLYAGMVSAPLVIPEVIQGISLLLLFVEMGNVLSWPNGRGFLTILAGHVMLCLSYVAIIVQSRIRELDCTIEDAARDLGATPLKVFFTITLPMLAPALAAGWLLAFTLSFDDVVLSAFLSGPGSTTLPLIIFSRVRLGLNPETNALATIFITVLTIAVIVVNTIVLSRNRRKNGKYYK